MFRHLISSAGLAAALISPVLYGFTYPSPQSTTLSSRSNLVSINFPRTTRTRTGPARTAGAGTRGSCPVPGRESGVTPMTVLMPEDNVGTTDAANPNLYIYLPELGSEVKGARVEVYGAEDEQNVYSQNFTLPENLSQAEGIVKFPLKDANLEPGKTYGWTVTPLCLDGDSEPQDADRSIGGLLEREPLSPEDRNKLDRADTPAEAAEIYAQAGVWNETLALVDKLRQTKPEEWVNLLNSVGLDDIARAPYIGEAAAISDPDRDRGNNAALQDSSSPEEDKNNNAVEPIRGLW